MKATVCGVLLCLVGLSGALYTSSDDVIMLDSSNFNRDVLQGNDLWLIEFFAPWCGHCKQLAPEWKKAATALKGIVKIGAVDMDKDGSVGGPYNVKGFPTIKIFGSNKKSPSDYNGGRTAQAIVDSAMSALKEMVNSRLSGGGSRSGGGGGGGGGGGSGGKDVIELTDSNFESTVLQSDDLWLVEFFAPWCGHCKSLEPEWARAASDLKGKVKLGALDATVHTTMASRYGVRGFPTIKMFPKGAKDNAVEYDGGRTASDIVQWATNKLSENLPPPEVIEITEQSVIEKACNDNQLCMVSILPNILDCQSECRNGYINALRKVGEKYKKNQWGWAWAEAGKQQELEDAIGIGGFGYPAMAAVNVRKMKYALLKGSFSESGITEFVREVAVGRGGTAPITKGKLPDIVSGDPWDGKDGKIEQVDDIDLDDVDLEPLDGPGFRSKKVEL